MLAGNRVLFRDGVVESPAAIMKSYLRGAPPCAAQRRANVASAGRRRSDHPGSAFFVRAKKADGKKRAPSLRPREIHARVPCASRSSRVRAELAGGENLAARARTPSREFSRRRLRCSAGSTGVLTATATTLGFAALNPTYVLHSFVPKVRTTKRVTWSAIALTHLSS